MERISSIPKWLSLDTTALSYPKKRSNISPYTAVSFYADTIHRIAEFVAWEMKAERRTLAGIKGEFTSWVINIPKFC